MAFLIGNARFLSLIDLETLYMKRLLTWVCLLAFVGGVMGEAAAQEPKKKPDPEAAFKKMDKDSDGKLTLEEFKANKKNKALENAEKQFARLDKNSDKAVSLEEFKAPRAPKKKDDKKPE